MELKKTIRSNEELYGDYELIPLNVDAVDQRIDFFSDKITALLKTNYNSDELTKFLKALNFWIELKDKHCLNQLSPIFPPT